MILDKKRWTIQFGLNLKRVIDELEVTQRELSRRTGIRPSTIGDYIKGKYTPSITSVVAMAQALGVDYYVLLEVEGDFGVHTKIYEEFDEVSELEWLADFSWGLRHLVIESDLSQTYLADFTGLSQSMISKYLKGQVIPSAYAVVLIARELAYDDDYDEILEFGTIKLDRVR